MVSKHFRTRVVTHEECFCQHITLEYAMRSAAEPDPPAAVALHRSVPCERLHRLAGPSPLTSSTAQDRHMNGSHRTRRWPQWLASGLLLAAGGGGMPGGERWIPPLGVPLQISTGFLAPPNPYAAGHRGFDLGASAGTEIVAPTSGVVTFAGTIVDRPVLSIRVDAQTVVSLEPAETELSAGASVTRGAAIGIVSHGGHCAAHCLHLGVRVDGNYVNPLRYFAGRPKLLPWG